MCTMPWPSLPKTAGKWNSTPRDVIEQMVSAGLEDIMEYLLKITNSIEQTEKDVYSNIKIPGCDYSASPLIVYPNPSTDFVHLAG